MKTIQYYSNPSFIWALRKRYATDDKTYFLSCVTRARDSAEQNDNHDTAQNDPMHLRNTEEKIVLIINKKVKYF